MLWILFNSQIDFILVPQNMQNQVTNAIYTDTIGLGSDHRTATAILVLDSTPVEPRRQRRDNQPGKGWSPKDVDKFKAQVCSRITAAKTTAPERWDHTGAEHKCRALEHVLLEAAADQKGIDTRAPSQDDKHRLRELIEQRRVARRSGSKQERTLICKAIQKEIKAIDKSRKSARVRRMT